MKSTVTPDRFLRAFPKALAMLREARGLSQAELARRLEVTAATMCRYESGVNKPGVTRLAQLLQVLELDFGDLDQALKLVVDAEAAGVEPEPDMLLTEDLVDPARLHAAYAVAVGQGQGEDFFQQATLAYRGLARMRRHLIRMGETARESTEQAAASELLNHPKGVKQS